jgi:hypothetical protein
MAETAYAVLTVTVEVDSSGGGWGPSCTLEQLKGQAARECRERLMRVLERGGAKGIRVRRSMAVRAVIVDSPMGEDERALQVTDRQRLWEALTDLLHANLLEVDDARAKVHQSNSCSALDVTLTEDERKRALELLEALSNARAAVDEFRRTLGG